MAAPCDGWWDCLKWILMIGCVVACRVDLPEPIQEVVDKSASALHCGLARSSRVRICVTSCWGGNHRGLGPKGV